jgi:DEAD/DEAH box helicase domain-containing protein
MLSPPWSQPAGVRAVLDQWLESGTVRPCVSAQRLIGHCAAEPAPIPEQLAPSLTETLARRGITSLYSHQLQAISAARRGRDVVVATPTASGKSLCFHVPVLQAIVEDPSSSAIYVYPTKALSRDQEHSLLDLIADAGLKVPAAVYDGDTPGDARRVARERCRIVLTNPDMLHAGILPNHTRWASVFQSLKYVVLDELHTYRGVFGSHMAHVVARLRRVARFHGSNPVFITATATIGNPRSHAARLLGVQPEQLVLVDRSGAPRSSRHVFIYNPPVLNADLGIRGSALKHAVSLASDLVRAQVPTIVFGPSRNSVEVMLTYLRERCRDVKSPDSIMAYRGGYLPDTRRRVERGLRDGEILCVVATNALELGIDIGDLDAVICATYPGSVAGTWQRFGRAGRRGDLSIAVLVCSSAAIDQYLAREPQHLLDGGAEEARIDPANVEVLIQHLKCAAFEAPFELSSPGTRPARPEPASGESYFTLDAAATRDALDYLGGHGLVHESSGRYHWTGDAFPANHVSLRNIGWDNFVIINVEADRSIAELDWRAAHTMLHEQAIYQHEAEQYQVERLDYDNHKAFVRKVKPDYFTTALTYRTVEVIDETHRGSVGRSSIGLGDVKVVEKVTGYKKIKFFTHENAGYGDVHLPEMQMHTSSFWLTIPEALCEQLELGRALLIDGLRGLSRALKTVCCVALMCDPRDLGRTLGDGEVQGALASTEEANLPPGRNPYSGRTGGLNPTLFLFDAHPGGVGLAPAIYERAEELLGQAEELVRTCPCGAGCPGCVGPSHEQAARKRTAARIVGLLGLHDRPAAAPRVASHRTNP